MNVTPLSTDCMNTSCDGWCYKMLVEQNIHSLWKICMKTTWFVIQPTTICTIIILNTLNITFVYIQGLHKCDIQNVSTYILTTLQRCTSV